MHLLDDSLNRITQWMKKFQPRHMESFIPGLSRQEIYNQLKTLNVSIPEEIYELYQWRNGREKLPFVNCAFSPSFYDFLSIDEIVNEYDLLNNPDCLSARENKGHRFIPLFGGSTHEVYGQTIDIYDGKTTFFSMLFEEDGSLEFYCNSIRSMLCTWADACETGAYRIVDEVEVEGHMVPLIEEDSDLVAPLLRKNNPGVAERAVEDITLLGSLSEAVDENVSTRIINALRLLQRYKHPSASNIISESIERNRNLFSYKNQNILCFVSATLGDLSDKRAIKALTTILSKTGSEQVKLHAEDSISRLINQ